MKNEPPTVLAALSSAWLGGELGKFNPAAARCEEPAATAAELVRRDNRAGAAWQLAAAAVAAKQLAVVSRFGPGGRPAGRPAC